MVYSTLINIIQNDNENEIEVIKDKSYELKNEILKKLDILKK